MICLTWWPWNCSLMALRTWTLPKKASQKTSKDYFSDVFFRQTVHKNWKYNFEKYSMKSFGPRWFVERRHWTVDWRHQIWSWLWFCYSASRGLRDCWAMCLTALAWIVCTEATKLLAIAEDCTCSWIVGLSWYGSIDASLLWPVLNTSYSRILQSGCFEDGYWCRPNTVRYEVSREASFLTHTAE